MKSFIPHSLLMMDDMSERKVIKAKSTKKQEEREARNKKVGLEVSLDSQARLAEILNDSPRLVNLAGTEWEVRTLRQKVQWMIAEEVVKINKIEQGAGYGDIVKQFASNMPSVVKVITLALLNDRHKIFEEGIESNGFSELYKATYDTIAWEGKVEEYGNLLLEVLQLLDISFFMESHRILELFRASTMARKTRMNEQK
jgi:hypothetical protein